MSDQATVDVDLAAPDSAEAVVANSFAVLDLVRAASDAIDEAGHLTPEIARVFRDAGLFQMGFPASRGGLEMPLAQQVEVVTRIARADGSAGWNVGVLNATGMYAGRLDADTYAELYPHRDFPTSGSFHPRGRSDRVEGGWMVSGQWDWGSGSYSAEYILGGCTAFDAGEPIPAPSGDQLLLGVWLPREAIEVAHNWKTLGVRGSGSTSYSITTPVFVPASHVFDREAPADGSKDPMNKSVHVAFFGLTGVSLGLAQHAVDLAVASVRAKAARSGVKSIDTATTQALGLVIADVDATYAGVVEVARRTDELLFETGRGLTEAQIQRMAAQQSVATEMLRRVLPICVDLVSSKYIFDGEPMQRVVRDSYGAFAHIGGRKFVLGGLASALVDDPNAGPLLVDDASREKARDAGTAAASAARVTTSERR
jgi:alkylation response protein AidB-like acyl-CoA dehydrogenase